MDELILFVEDDPAIRDVTARGLEDAGFKVESEADGRQALVRFRQANFDLVLLDLMLPSLGGVEVCRFIRSESTVPVVMLTARDDTSDVVLGLEVGADDYLTKPFEMPELVARLRAVLRRSNALQDGENIVAGELEIDGDAFIATKRGAPLDLTSTEFKLLLELARSSGKVRTRDSLLEAVWDYDYLGDSRIVDMAVKRLRNKIEDDPHDPKRIVTVRGVGYRFEP
jgi:two-component system response regulator MtrA